MRPDRRQARFIGMRGAWLAAAAFWGFAEATLFFIVPDVLLSYLTLRHGVPAGLRAGIAAVGGAVLGGAAMYLWGARDPSAAEAALDLIPAISVTMISATQSDLTNGWAASLFAGAFGGIPYKIFAVEAGHVGIDPVAFLAMTMPARYARFVLAVLATGAARSGLARIGQERHAAFLLGGFWLCFYAIYFAMMPD